MSSFLKFLGLYTAVNGRPGHTGYAGNGGCGICAGNRRISSVCCGITGRRSSTGVYCRIDRGCLCSSFFPGFYIIKGVLGERRAVIHIFIYMASAVIADRNAVRDGDLLLGLSHAPFFGELGSSVFRAL